MTVKIGDDGSWLAAGCGIMELLQTAVKTRLRPIARGVVDWLAASQTSPVLRRNTARKLVYTGSRYPEVDKGQATCAIVAVLVVVKGRAKRLARRLGRFRLDPSLQMG